MSALVRFADLQPGPAPQLDRSVFASRRRRLATSLGSGHVMVVATHPPAVFSNDVAYTFRPGSDFWYLTGFEEPGAVLFLEGGSGRTTLFVQERDPKREIWTGRRLGVERAAITLGVDAAFGVGELASRFAGIVGKSKVHALCNHHVRLRAKLRRLAGTAWVPEASDGRPGGPAKRTRRGYPHGGLLLHRMRLVKSTEEIRLLAKACDVGVAAHKAAAQAAQAGATEYQVEAAFYHHARRAGSTGVGYPSICGCGPNAAVLHYVRNRDRLQRGQLLLNDAGCEWGYYTSDITRTLPVGGAFTRDQLAIYELVQAAHKAAMAKVRPGNLFRAPHEAAVQVLAQGLLDLNVLSGRFEDVLAKKAYQAHFMHGTSHHLGLDVHDAGGTTEPDGSPLRLEEGMVMTVEPGLYFNDDFARGPARYRGIGVRIEDDVMVTASGRRLLSRGLAVDPEGVADLVRP